MDHARHRAQRRHRAGVFAAGAVVGLLVGVLAAVALTWAADLLPGRHDGVAATGPLTRSAVEGPIGTTGRSDRGEGIVARSRLPGSTPAAATAPVLLLGDSLAVGIAPYLDAGLGERPFSTDAAEGRRTATQVDLLASHATTSPSTWLVSLGTNDNYEEFPKDAADLMELAGPARCVVWFDVWRPVDDEINAALTALAARHPNLYLVPWHDVSEAHPEWFTGADVHPSSAGYAVRGQLAVDALAEHCAAP